ncbi:DNA polymerase III subunit beta [Pararhizobium sp. BT-229]|uniref:DNA polymerase III subunit beta n=1 Tax=Pararhizobium sp. BT-229 TaxID=2986923 RepID=UPI0021F78DA4|nr:DNA polymerase III subunit beta [Pararhizobium sp. BT-229]MCV9960765.1 DNA polymerase III subunit beta [Pararhizobium sp. BT-229]
MQNVVKLFPSENPSALVDRAEFTETIGLLAKLASSRSAVPILNHIRLSSEPGGLAFAATNLDIQAETSLAADVDARFSAALPAAALLKLMKKGTPSNTAILELLPDGEQSEADRFVASKCSIQLADTRFLLDVMSSDDFPNAIRHEEGAKVQRFSIASAVLWNAIDGTLDAVSTDETRYHLNGIFVHSHNGRLRFTATDGHRLYIQDTNIQTGKSEVAGILPTEGAKLIASLLDGHAGAMPAQVELSATVAVLVFRDVAVTVKLIDGTFPDYQRVIPAAPDKMATIEGAAFAAAVASLVDCTGAAHVKLAFEPQVLAISAKGATGEGSTEIACTYEGDTLQINFDAKYLRSAIDAASPDGKSLKIRMADALSPAIVTGSIGGWSGVLMPTQA